ncbi:MAG TPA: hypothetical protein VJN18_03130 [Polyangiaceae bacterium]|nr:hypothetical protein [Polyangiaceae bacterium]
MLISVGNLSHVRSFTLSEAENEAVANVTDAFAGEAQRDGVADQ